MKKNFFLLFFAFFFAKKIKVGRKKRENKIGSKSTVSISPNFALRRKICKSPVRQSEIRGNSRPRKKKTRNGRRKKRKKKKKKKKEKKKMKSRERETCGVVPISSPKTVFLKDQNTLFFRELLGVEG